MCHKSVMRCISNYPKISVNQSCSLKSILISEVVLDNRLSQNNRRFLCCFFQESSRWSPISAKAEDFDHRLSVKCPHDCTIAKRSGSCWTIAARFDSYCDIIILGLISLIFIHQLARRALYFTRRGSELHWDHQSIWFSAFDCWMNIKSGAGLNNICMRWW